MSLTPTHPMSLTLAQASMPHRAAPNKYPAALEPSRPTRAPPSASAALRGSTGAAGPTRQCAWRARPATTAQRAPERRCRARRGPTQTVPTSSTRARLGLGLTLTVSPNPTPTPYPYPYPYPYPLPLTLTSARRPCPATTRQSAAPRDASVHRAPTASSVGRAGASFALQARTRRFTAGQSAPSAPRAAIAATGAPRRRRAAPARWGTARDWRTRQSAR